MRLHRLALVAAVAGFAGLASGAPGTTGSFRIVALQGTVVRAGTLDGEPLYEVSLRARLCFRSAATALRSVPEAVTITHYAVHTKTGAWETARTVTDHPAWLVSFAENWHGRCGPASFTDPIPESDWGGVESVLGNAGVCYGARLSIRTAGTTAGRRALITCRPPWRDRGP